jgi:4-amino-4-deoxy-L-arabinose transferase-like glycosyltransferase/membrane-associated phospholipid phosphatase
MKTPAMNIHRVSWGGAVLCFLLSFLLDDWASSFVSSHQTFWVNTFMEWTSHYGRGHPLALLCALHLVVGLLLKKKNWLETAGLSLYSLALSSLSGQILKHLIGRTRPRLIEQGLAFGGPSLSAGVTGFDSFPSGHATSTFALAVVLTRAYPAGSPLFYMTASVISFSRLYLGAHFLSDVIGGVLVGLWAGRFIVNQQPRILKINERVEHRAKGLFAATGVLLLAVLLFFYNLKAVPLFDVDEAVFAETTREMLETGSFITPIYNYSHRYDKPILIYWLMASAFAVLGTNELAARFWSALAGCGVVLLTFFFARAVSTLRVAALSAIILTTSLEMLVLSHLAITDMVLTLLIAASLLGFFLALHQKESSRQTLWALLAWIAAAGAVLTKGPIGIIFPASIVLIFLWFSGGGREGMRRLRPRAGVALFLSLTLPWYVAASWTTKGEFLRVFLVHHNVMRYLSVNSGHDGPWYYYLLIVALGFLPWTAFLPASLRSAWRHKIVTSQGGRERNLPIFLLLWIFGVLLFFSFSHTKLPNYIAPLFPALSLLVGWWWDRVLSGQEEEKSIRFSAILGGVAALILILSLVALPFVAKDVQANFSSHPGFTVPGDLRAIPFFLAATVALAAAGFFVVLRKEKSLEGFGLIVVGAVFFSFVLFEGLLPKAGSYLQEPLRILALSASNRLKPGEPLIILGLNKPSLLFYAKRPAIMIGAADLPKLRESVSQPQRRLIVTSVSLSDRLADDIRLYPVEREGTYILLSNRPESSK